MVCPGFSLAIVREKLIEAKNVFALGKSLAHEKQREKRRLIAVQIFGNLVSNWVADTRLHDIQAIVKRKQDVSPEGNNRDFLFGGHPDRRDPSGSIGASCANSR